MTKPLIKSKSEAVLDVIRPQVKAILDKDGQAFLDPYLIMGKSGVSYMTAKSVIAVLVEEYGNDPAFEVTSKGRNLIIKLVEWPKPPFAGQGDEKDAPITPGLLRATLRAHQEAPPIPTSFKCPKCKIDFGSQTALDWHKERGHKKRVAK